MRTFHWVVSTITALLFAVPVFAQAPAAAPAPVPEAMPNYIPIGTPITLDQARKVAAAAEAEAKKRNWKMAIAIVEPTGELIYFQKMDDTQYASVKIAQSKARSAATFRRPTKVFFDAMESGHPYVATLDGMSGAEGGLPIVDGGKMIGAIGVSGGAGVQDSVVAKAGVDSVR
jgi:uncharacterized protein GlcG (DUF336 family)